MRQELLTIIKKYAYRERDVVLASGQKSDFYIDCKQAALRGDGAFAIGALFYDAMNAHEAARHVHYAACAGMALGALPLSVALTLRAFSDGRHLPSLCVRKEVKTHGSAAQVEGRENVEAGARVVLVEDVVTTGGSTLKAAAALREAGYQVDHVIAIVDREAGGEANLRAEGLSLNALFHVSDLRG